MLKTYLAFASISIFIASSAAFAQSGGIKVSSGNGGDPINIPADIREIVPQADLVKLVCYEAKWRGGEAIAKINAAKDTLAPVLENAKKLGAEIDPSALDVMSAYADSIDKKIDAVCASNTLDEARARVADFMSFGRELRKNIQVDLAGKIKARIEPKMREIESKAREELKAKMKNEATREAKEIENRIRAEEKDYVMGRKNEIVKRIKNRVKRQMTREFKERMDPNGDNSKLAKELTDKGTKLGKRLGAAEGEKLKAEMREKYKKLAEREKQRLEEKYKKKGEKMGGEKKKEAERIAEKLKNIGASVEKAVKRTNGGVYAEYKEKAELAKKSLMARAIDFYMEKAKAEIERQRPLIEAARNEKKSISGKYGIKSVEEYLRELEADKTAIINELLGKTKNRRSVSEIKKDFTRKWNKIRGEMEKVKMLARGDIIKMIKEKADWNAVSKTLDKWKKFADKQNEEYKKDSLACEKEAKTAYDCEVCPLMDKKKELADMAVSISDEIVSAKKLIEKIGAYSANGATLEEGIKLKDDLQDALQGLKNKKVGFLGLYDSYKDAVKSRLKVCENNK